MARMEAIRIFLAFATYMNFIVFQMDVKSANLNGKLKEEVYVKQPIGFESSEFPDYVYKFDKAIYRLKQALRASSSVKTLMVPPNNLGPDLAAEAKYVAAARCCAYILWMKSQLSDYDIHYKMRNIQLAGTGLPFTQLDEGTRKSQLLPEGRKSDPKDSVGNKQFIDTGFPSMVSDEGMVKTTPTGAKYQVDETQYNRLRVQESKNEEVFAAREKINEDIPPTDEEVNLELKKYDNILLLTERQLVKYLRKVSRGLFNRITKDQWEKYEEATVSYADLKASIEGYYEENVDHRKDDLILIESI
nr:retrovirus-related Pol polyprotein from transposon TNT 1-94 [Tanacetum cinerariifolium]